MNQILDMGETRNKRSGNKLNIKSIILYFGIFIIVFGVCIIASAVYAILINKSGKMENLKPTITVNDKNKDNKILNIDVKDDRGIDTITYTVNDVEKLIKVGGELEKEFSIDLTDGKNIVKISATDTDGEVQEHQEIYEIEYDVTVEFKQLDEKVNVSIESEMEIAYITYRWDEEEEKKEEVGENEYSLAINLPSEDGKHTLTVNVVDKNNMSTERTKNVLIDKPPVITVHTPVNGFKILAEDDEEISKIIITLNGEEKINEEVNDKTWEKTIPYVEGENKIIIKVYNLNDIEAISKIKLIND